MNQSKKVSMGFRLSPEAVSLIRKLAEDNGVSQVAVVEMAIRKFAKSS